MVSALPGYPGVRCSSSGDVAGTDVWRLMPDGQLLCGTRGGSFLHAKLTRLSAAWTDTQPKTTWRHEGFRLGDFLTHRVSEKVWTGSSVVAKS